MTIDINALPRIQTFELSAGLQTQLGTLIPPGSRVCAYVRSTGRQSNDPIADAAPIYTTLNAGLQQSRGYGDVVVVLPGHTESISTADAMSNLVAGTRIVGLGYGTLRPTLTWTATAATFLFDVANVSISNFIMCLAGSLTSTTALTVTAPITISAAGCSFVGCQIHCAVDANQLATIGITTTATAADLSFIACTFHTGTSDGSSITTNIRLVGADRLKMYGCSVYGATSSTTVGAVQMLTTASLDVDIRDCIFTNRKASCVNSFTGMTGATGTLSRCYFGVLDDATLAGINTAGSLQLFDCRTTNVVAENGGITTPVSA